MHSINAYIGYGCTLLNTYKLYPPLPSPEISGVHTELQPAGQAPVQVLSNPESPGRQPEHVGSCLQVCGGAGVFWVCVEGFFVALPF